MRVIVFGATGSIGKLTVKRLLEQGHQVTAFARRPERIGMLAANSKLVPGDARDRSAVSRAIKNHDAVVVTLGAGMSRKSRIRSQGTLNIIQGMHDHGVKRLICQSTLGAHESWENLNFFWKRIMFGALLRPVFKDHELQEQLVRASGLDWTIVRPSAFDAGPATGSFKVGFGPEERGLALKISRDDIVDFLTRQLDDLRFRKAAVGISN